THSFLLNVANAESIKAFLGSVLHHYNRLDIWVNNAGIYPFIGALDITDEDYDKLININQRGTFISTREAANAMIATSGGGVIINIVST
ncbi:SDR family NAD(P)-dependent oxidoreductase, partial [Vibrio parahaemolyticus]